MAPTRTDRPTPQQIAIFRVCFSGLTHVYGSYDPGTGRAYQVKQPVTDQVLLRHLRGIQPYGVYLLVRDRTRAVVVDFDEENPEPVLEFVHAAAHYGLPVYLERSKRKGWHAWVFTELPGVPAVKARKVVRLILEEIGRPATEIFPKQDRLSEQTPYGNWLHSPLWGLGVPQGRTVFVDIKNHLKPYPDQWHVLEHVRRVTERQLDELIEINDRTVHTPARNAATENRRLMVMPRSYGLPPCAQRMLAEGVQDNQRVACFRLAGHLRKAGIPEDVAVAGLRVWATKNRPTNGKGVITDDEIVSQVHYAYSRSYRGCGCEDAAIRPFCDPNCPVRNPVKTVHSRER